MKLGNWENLKNIEKLNKMLTKAINGLIGVYRGPLEEGSFAENHQHYRDLIQNMPPSRVTVQKMEKDYSEGIFRNDRQRASTGTEAWDFASTQLEKYGVDLTEAPFQARVYEKDGLYFISLILNDRDSRYMYKVEFDGQPSLVDRIKSLFQKN